MAKKLQVYVTEKSGRVVYQIRPDKEILEKFDNISELAECSSIPESKVGKKGNQVFAEPHEIGCFIHNMMEEFRKRKDKDK